ncbi:NHLP family bacteriocin export ABC transporter peptidase/permease/ATPase subunit [Paratractidigestivibacter sp.]|uniref:NHLP family bacteriocin export ABC transporter peptidase/permease/ATPase subunit n=1 Tax=Paratractidigestivibacter sp. TaxID=2847316 RepID=UPI002AC9D2CA|nr:NHLP family bacteriocin export ABC transporter peptidase/permease/ATPase subunit [Paratractidigestivibacter sp.]
MAKPYNRTPAVAAPGKTIRRVPQIMQMEALECGAACLAMICAYYGKWIALEKVRGDCGVSRDGSNALNVIKAARSYNMEAHGYRYEPEALREKGTFPCIAHVSFNHFVVVRGFKGNKVLVNDPARGETTFDLDYFDREFTGIVLQITPGEGFVADGRPASVRDFAAKRLRGARAALVFVAITSAIGQALSLVSPYMSKIFMDYLLPGTHPDWAPPFLALFIAFGAIQVIISALNAIYLLRVQGKMAATSNASFFWKVLHMPMEFFSQRMTGDIAQRMNTNSTIAQTVVGQVAPLAMNCIMLVVYLFMMIQFSPHLAALGLFSIAVDALVAHAMSKRRVNASRVMMRDSANLASTTMAGISMIETIKAQGVEAGYFRRWSGYQASVNRQMVQLAKQSVWISMIPELVNLLTKALLLGVGIWLIIAGQITVGALTTMQSLVMLFASPAQTLISSMQSFQEMRTDMERVKDVMDYPDDPLCAPERDAELGEGASCEKLAGKIDLENVTFGYSKLGKPVVSDFSLHVKAGGCVAFVGSSGCGKSTIAKLIAGLYEPWEGQIRIDDRPLAQIPRAVRCGSIAVVDQEIMLFADTVSNNIRLWDTSIEDFEVILAARDAQIHDDIVSRPGGYERKLSEGGRDLSGGQRQRIEIARALAMDPTVIIMDEATSALDAQTEAKVMDAMRKRGITLVIIAHRLSTVRDADEIIVFDQGTIAERGTHEELIATDGVYTNLISQE